MTCGWPKLDKVETDCEKVNLKKRRPDIFESVQSEASGKWATKSSKFAI